MAWVLLRSRSSTFNRRSPSKEAHPKTLSHSPKGGWWLFHVLLQNVARHAANFVALAGLLVPRSAASIPVLLAQDNNNVMYVSMDYAPIAHKETDTPAGANPSVQDVIRRVERELRELMEARAEVTRRIGTVKQTILGLANLFGDGILNQALSDLVDRKAGPRQPGITRACRRVLMEAGRPMSGLEVCDEIQRTVPALLVHHKDPIATIKTILSRLVEYGEATLLRGDRGQRCWLWAAARPGAIREPEGRGSGPA